MTEAQDTIARLRAIAGLHFETHVPLSMNDARAILAHIDALTAERDHARNIAHDALEQLGKAADERDAALAKVPKIVSWLREIAAQPVSDGDTGQAVARRIACEFFAVAIERGEYEEAGDVAGD